MFKILLGKEKDMKHKSLGIIQIDLPEITLDDNFGEVVMTTITSLLSEKQKSNIIQALKGEKNVIVNGIIIDATGNELELINTSFNINAIDGERCLSTTINDSLNDKTYPIILKGDEDNISIYS